MENQTLSSTSREDGSIIISSGKRLTIETAADFTQRIQKALSSAVSVAVTFDAGVEVDITALQVLCSACKTAAAEEGKTFSYCGELPRALVDLITTCGAGFHGLCKQNNSRICIWFGDGT
ncbi:MAG: hypothetical protein C4531_16010 [Desulfurivibrio sp.]|nr:MAG: hypothetical protein C4531_16010 [Desulfurivibrio sp.]